MARCAAEGDLRMMSCFSTASRRSFFFRNNEAARSSNLRLIIGRKHVSAAPKLPGSALLASGRTEDPVFKTDFISSEAPLRVLIAGGGLGGLFAAIALRKAGADVTVLERTANYRTLGGPIQLASNGVSTIKATSERLFERVHEVSRPFWDTASGIRDGLSGKWMFKFEAITELPVERNLPFSICVDRCDLQGVLLEEIGSNDTVLLGSNIVRYRNNNSEDGGGITAILEDGRELQADVLIGADGIWSQVRAQMFGEPPGRKGASSTANFTGFKLYSGLPIFKPYYYADVGYSAFIGPDHYFVVCPDRAGRVQWYGFIKAVEPNTPDARKPKEYLLEKLKASPSNCCVPKNTQYFFEGLGP